MLYIVGFIVLVFVLSYAVRKCLEFIYANTFDVSPFINFNNQTDENKELIQNIFREINNQKKQSLFIKIFNFNKENVIIGNNFKFNSNRFIVNKITYNKDTKEIFVNITLSMMTLYKMMEYKQKFDLQFVLEAKKTNNNFFYLDFYSFLKNKDKKDN